MLSIINAGRLALAMGFVLGLTRCDKQSGTLEPAVAHAVTPVTPNQPYAPQIVPADFAQAPPIHISRSYREPRSVTRPRTAQN